MRKGEVSAMKARLMLGLFTLCLWSLASRAVLSAQVATSQVPQPGVVLVKLSPLKYPPIARGARIMGDVNIDLEIRPDGSIESAKLFSGPPILAPAAVQSAKESTFACRNCTEITSHRLTYTFAIRDQCPGEGDCSATSEKEPEIHQLADRVTITVDPLCTCDPSVTITRRKWRSAKCLYLWRCQSRVVDEELHD